MSSYELTSDELSAATMAMHNTSPSDISNIIFMVISLVAFCLTLAIVFSVYSGYQSGKIKVHDLWSGFMCACIILVSVGCLIK